MFFAGAAHCAPVSGIPLEVNRTYDTRDQLATGDFGHGWRLDVQNVKVEESGVFGEDWREGVYGGAIKTYCVAPEISQLSVITSVHCCCCMR